MAVTMGYGFIELMPDGCAHVTCTDTSNIGIVGEALSRLTRDSPAMKNLRNGQYANMRLSQDGAEHAIVLLPHTHEGELAAVSILGADQLLDHLPLIERVRAELRNHGRRIGGANRYSTDTDSSLTQRQLAIVAHMAQGCTNSEIARKICFSESTVRMETISIYRKLNVDGRKEAVVRAKELGLLTPAEPNLVTT